jgi:hypothetical protein
MTTKWAWMAAAALAVCMVHPSARAAQAYRCVDAQGHVTLSDHPCPVVQAPAPPPPAPPCPLTAEERRRAERLEEQFLRRFPNEAGHRAARLADLQEIVARLRLARNRLAELARERKSIDDELEFYKGKTPTPELARRLDASEAKFGALADVFRGDEQDIRNVVARYDCEQKQFGALWRGGAPGSSACTAACQASR